MMAGELPGGGVVEDFVSEGEQYIELPGPKRPRRSRKQRRLQAGAAAAPVVARAVSHAHYYSAALILNFNLNFALSGISWHFQF